MNIYMVPEGAKHPAEAVKFALWAGNGSAVIANEDIWRTYSGYKQKPTDPKNKWQRSNDAAYKVTQLLSTSPNATNGPLLPITAQLTNELWAAPEQHVSRLLTGDGQRLQQHGRSTPAWGWMPHGKRSILPRVGRGQGDKGG